MTMKMRRQEGPERREEDDDGNADGQELPAFKFGSRISHELTVVYAYLEVIIILLRIKFIISGAQ